VDTLLESGDPWFAAAYALLVGVAVALAVGVAVLLFARRLLRDENRAQRTSMVAFWGVVAIFGLIAVVRLLGGTTAEAGLTVAGNRLFQTLPDLVIALVIVIVGSVLASAARAAIIRSMAPHRPRAAEWLAVASRISILVLAVLLGARQIGVRTALLEGLVLVLAAMGLLAAALAVGLGGRGIAAAYAAGRHAGAVLTVGDVIELDGRRGRVIRLGPTSVRLHLADGATAEVPNTLLLGQTVVVYEHEEPAPAPPPADTEEDDDATLVTPSADRPMDGPVPAGAVPDDAAVDVDDVTDEHIEAADGHDGTEAYEVGQEPWRST
jgi:small-conductance mechanosensitive channel